MFVNPEKASVIALATGLGYLAITWALIMVVAK